LDGFALILLGFLRFVGTALSRFTSPQPTSLPLRGETTTVGTITADLGDPIDDRGLNLS
jgi:hypothetical protein